MVLHDQNQERHLKTEKEITVVTKEENEVILGDFNYSHIDWTNMCLSHVTETLYLEIMTMYCHTDHSAGTLHLVLSLAQDLLRGVHVVSFGNSDHYAVKFNIHVNRNVSPKLKIITFGFKRKFLLNQTSQKKIKKQN